MPAGILAFDDAHHRRHDRDNKEKMDKSAHGERKDHCSEPECHQKCCDG